MAKAARTAGTTATSQAITPCLRSPPLKVCSSQPASPASAVATLRRPACVRRYPFCIWKRYVDGEPSSERVVCVAAAYIDAGGVELFDPQGRATPAWQGAERLLTEYEADLDRTAQMCAALARLQVLEP